MVVRSTIFLLVVFCGAGCEREERADAPAAATASRDVTPASNPSNPATRSSRPRIVFLGDSLTAGLGIEAEQAFPALVGELLEAEGRPVDVVNAGVSGDTTAGGLRRLDWLLRQKPARSSASRARRGRRCCCWGC
jgi:acyl-CoA thioesterase-1